ncbi:ATP synthase subunit I [Crenobacter cavernae]|uniref:ATP synthase subunit I n=1 Tax=Crenobacter cavernae TaxID=2290923 RepID=A0ABY0FF33_9NEIS|nr:ATP synthase subunit I [Crenobacter cavernae]RXZ43664.1 hypothetical protein EBB06_08620 [Crenobacter cavernae]
MVNPEVRRVLQLQILFTLVAVIAAAAWGGVDSPLPGSILVGGAAAFLPALAYARIAYARRRISPAELMRAHFIAEAVKFLLTVVIFGVVALFFKNMSVPALVIGYLVAASAYWFGLLSKN